MAVTKYGKVVYVYQKGNAFYDAIKEGIGYICQLRRYGRMVQVPKNVQAPELSGAGSAKACVPQVH